LELSKFIGHGIKKENNFFEDLFEENENNKNINEMNFKNIKNNNNLTDNIYIENSSIKNHFLKDLEVKHLSTSSNTMCEPQIKWVNFNCFNGNDKKFIVTQGPLNDTVYDFWRMVIQCNIKVIVMLTNLVEDGREKCAQYWPNGNENSSLIVQDIEIKILSVTSEDSFVNRVCEITQNDIRYEILQIQYIEWPDHGIPTTPDSFLQLNRNVNQQCYGDDSPILVHCSAGIGRTGTFCCVNVVVDFIEKYFEEHNELPDVSIVSTILKFRSYRMGMVQSPDQLQFCYDAIYKEVHNLRKAQRKNIKQTITNENENDSVSYFLNKY